MVFSFSYSHSHVLLCDIIPTNPLCPTILISTVISLISYYYITLHILFIIYTIYYNIYAIIYIYYKIYAFIYIYTHTQYIILYCNSLRSFSHPILLFQDPFLSSQLLHALQVHHNTVITHN